MLSSLDTGEGIVDACTRIVGSSTDGHGLVRQLVGLRGEPVESVDSRSKHVEFPAG